MFISLYISEHRHSVCMVLHTPNRATRSLMLSMRLLHTPNRATRSLMLSMRRGSCADTQQLKNPTNCSFLTSDRLGSSALSAVRAVFSSGCSCSHFFAVSSQNCGGSSAGYSLLIQHFTSLPGVSVSVRAHRRWLRMLSTALEEDIKVLHLL